jgi:hypothetical protein
MVDITSETFSHFETWYHNLRPMKQYGGRPAKGTIAAALVVLESLRESCNLDISAHLADGGAQIARLSLARLKKILERFGENREFPSEGGRTNRGNNRPMKELLDALQDCGFARLSVQKRVSVIDHLQERLVRSLDAYYRLERIRFDYNSAKTLRAIVAEILTCAQQRNQGGPVAQHLVGAKLAIRFPSISVSNLSYSAADDQGGRSGDFHVGNTAFHVTVAPNTAHIARCAENIRQGLGAWLLVNELKLAKARDLLEGENLQNKVVAESIESFVGQNLSELAEFSASQFGDQLASLLVEYNRRVTAVETDASLLIDIPAAIQTQED